MAKTNAPLLSWGAGGQIAKTQVYASWKGRPYVRRYVIPANPNSSGQQETRGAFKFLNGLWKYLPSGALEAWKLYADNSRITDRNAWIKQNLAAIRGDVNLNNLLASPAAGSGIVAAAMNIVAGADQLTVNLTAPSLPAGWTITAAHALAILDVNPQVSQNYVAAYASDATTPYSCVITGLTATTPYQVGGWFEFARPGGKAFGQALMAQATPT